MLVDLRPKRVTGKAAEASLDRAHITGNKNAIPFDPEKPTITSGMRLGTRPPPRAASARPSSADRANDRRGAWRRCRNPTTAAMRRPSRRWASGCWRCARASRSIPGAKGLSDALPVLRSRRYPGEGQPPQRGRLARSAAGASARPAASASPPSNGCSCAS